MDNNKILNKSAQSIQNYFDQLGIKIEVCQLPSSTRTAAEAAQSIGCNREQIVKSLVFKTVNTSKPILVLASGPNRVNETNIELIIGEKIIKADAQFTREVTGFAIGGIPPIGHKQPLRTFIDEDLLKCNDVWAAAGTPHAVFNIKSDILLTLTGATVIPVQ